MNYLAHIFLSGDDKQLQLGNFMGDAVKGNSWQSYPPAVRDGILLHRAIDSFTDRHPNIKEAVIPLKPHFGRYSAVMLDIFFDYLLASRFKEYSAVTLKKFTRDFYLNMILRRRFLPPRIRRFMWHFIATDRLGKYATKEGIGLSIGIMETYGRLNVSPAAAVEYLSNNQEKLLTSFRPFFSDLQKYCSGYLASEDRPEYIVRNL